ncbi:MAG: DUF6088 family protein (plasmid) [Candidatus Symbiodolus clandestinus]
MSYLAEKILSTIRSLPEGGLISPKDFLHLATRAAVDQTLSRLTRENKLLRIGRGIYTAPLYGQFGSRPPSTAAVMRAIESITGEVIVANGATEANTLGLTTQVPVREIFITSGPSRKLHLGKRHIELRHGRRWQLVLGKQPAGRIIRALSWLGPEQASVALKTLHGQLSNTEWQALYTVRATLPSWMAHAISRVNFCD